MIVLIVPVPYLVKIVNKVGAGTFFAYIPVPVVKARPSVR
jgi:hypothetical protein